MNTSTSLLLLLLLLFFFFFFFFFFKSPNAAHNVERKTFDNFPDEDVVCVSEMGSTGGKKTTRGY